MVSAHLLVKRHGGTEIRTDIVVYRVADSRLNIEIECHESVCREFKSFRGSFVPAFETIVPSTISTLGGELSLPSSGGDAISTAFFHDQRQIRFCRDELIGVVGTSSGTFQPRQVSFRQIRIEPGTEYRRFKLGLSPFQVNCSFRLCLESRLTVYWISCILWQSSGKYKRIHNTQYTALEWASPVQSLQGAASLETFKIEATSCFLLLSYMDLGAITQPILSQFLHHCLFYSVTDPIGNKFLPSWAIPRVYH